MGDHESYIPKIVDQPWVFLPSNFSEPERVSAFSFKVGMDFAGEKMDSVDLGPRSQQLDGTHGEAEGWLVMGHGMLISKEVTTHPDIAHPFGNPPTQLWKESLYSLLVQV